MQAGKQNFNIAAVKKICRVTRTLVDNGQDTVIKINDCVQKNILTHTESDNVFPRIISSPERFPFFNGYLVHKSNHLASQGPWSIMDKTQSSKLTTVFRKNKNPSYRICFGFL